MGALNLNGETTAGQIGSTTVVAVFGGMASQATGGDFYEGAMRAAFVHLYNELHDPRLNGRGVPNAMGGDAKKNYSTPALDRIEASNEELWKNFKKGSTDIYDGLVAIPKGVWGYYKFLLRSTGYTDLIENNKLPYNKWEARLEQKALYYALTNHYDEIGNFLWTDFTNRPNYYLSGALLAPAVGSISKVTGAVISSVTPPKIDGAIQDYIHYELNPLH